ncbi:MAG: enolase C-terminal domain-like protein [Planctomycetota bacterium]
MRITAVRARPLNGTIREEVAIVSSLGAHAVGNYVLVEVEADDGQIGQGEATVTAVWSGETQGGTIAMIDLVLAPLLVGADPFDLAWIERRMAKACFGNSFARSAIEMALCDLQGRILNVPLCQLLGGRCPGKTDVRLKFVIGAVEPPIAAKRARQMVDAGWRAIKVKVGPTANPADDILRLAAVREAIGPDIFLSVDANGAFTVSDAVRLSREMEILDVAIFEQPTRRGRHREMREVRRRTAIPVMADESVFTFDDALDLLRAEAADLISVYPGKHGGMRPTMEIVRLAEAHGVPCTIGSNLERETATAAMAHLVAASPNLRCERYPGDLIGPLYFTRHSTRTPLDYRADRLSVPEGPGLGVQVTADG